LTAKTLIQESGGFIEKLILKKTYDFNWMAIPKKN
jgi:hypothetical protein